MTNADKFKNLFGIYATELWSMPEKDFLKWLNSEAMNCSEIPNNSDTISRQQAVDALADMHCKSDEDGYVWIIRSDAWARIDALPSAQPEPHYDEWCNDCKEYDKERHCCPRWNKVIRETLKDAQTEQRWIPCSERLPGDGRQVLVYAKSVHYALAKYDEMREADGTYRMQWVTFDAWKPFYTIKDVIAWMPLPEPYKEEQE